MGNTELGQDDLARAMYAEHGGVLRSYVQRMVRGDRHLAEDIVQETLLRAWRHGADLDVETARPWLFTARSARPVELPADDLDSWVTADEVDRALDAVLLVDALASLNDAHRTVLIECYYAGRSVAQVAEEHHLPAGTVRSRLHYALRALRMALQERGVSR